jgi:Carboxylesterase family
MLIFIHSICSYKLLGNVYSRDSEEWKYREMMCRMWTNFAKYTDPTPDHDTSLETKWLPVGKGKENDPINYLKITNDGNFMDQDVNKENIIFWRENLKKYNGSFLNPRLGWTGKDEDFK